MYKKILLIDDDADEQFFFIEALKEINASAKFFFANSAKEGLSLVKFLLPDFVFIDINMPAINGLECLDLIAHNEDILQPSIIIYSTTIDNSIRNNAIKKGATACLKKQNSIHELAKLLKNILVTNHDHSEEIIR
ncbi:MAG TPA: response regulator [Parafilimonas sp.]|jgi:CheY-like chemotaxis protein